ncbi:MAG TPA: VTT domain-containing protein [Candidatus Paceibacterota bacterium]|jgi:membrane-associated protein|nr:VTT domain-containing protein [Candidatus Paceibacterota bacterium]
MLTALAGYKYLLVFGGLILSGDIFLVSFIYSAKFGFVTLPYLFLTALLASAVSDFMWYALGRFIGLQRIQKIWFLRKNPALVEKLSAMFEKNGAKLLFMCKFLYGTRVVTEVITGMHRMKYAKYFLINLCTTIIWTLFLFLFVTAVDASVSSIKSLLAKIEIVITVFAAFFVLAHFAAKRVLWKK